VAAVAAEWVDRAMAPVELGPDLGSAEEWVAAAAPGAQQAQGPAEAQEVRVRAAEASGTRAAAVRVVPGRELPARAMDRALVRAQVPGDLQVLAAGSAVQVLEAGQAGRARVPVGAELGLQENG
jgi:hypothetical protein